MTATTTAALVPIQPAFSDAERLALAGFLAGYRGLTREAYALDLRQFTTWCRARSLNLFGVRRADIEGFARDLEARGRARATVTRRLCTIAGFYEVPRRGRAPGSLARRACPASAGGLRVPCRRTGPQRARRPAGRRRARPAARACADLAAGLERAAGLRGHRRGYRAPGPGTRPPDADDYPQGRQGRHRSRWRRVLPGRSIWPSASAPSGPVFLTADGRRLDRHGAGRIVRKTARRARIAKAVTPHTLRHAFITAALDAGVPLRDVQEAASHADPRTSQVAPARCRAGAPSEPDKRAFPASRLRQAQWRCG